MTCPGYMATIASWEPMGALLGMDCAYSVQECFSTTHVLDSLQCGYAGTVVLDAPVLSFFAHMPA